MNVSLFGYYNRRVLLVLTALIAPWGGPVAAQTDTTRAGGGHRDRQKRSERLQDVPMSITAATGDQLKTLGITDWRASESWLPASR